MKIGDKLEISIAGAVVGLAEVEAVREETVTILIPAQRVVARKRVQIDLTTDPNDSEGASSVVLTDSVEGPSEAVEASQEGAGASVSPANNEAPSVPVNTPEKPVEAAVEPVTPPVEAPAETVDEVSGSE
jgi:hypothetical protein